VFSYFRALLLLILLFYMAIIYESISLALLGLTGTALLVCSFFYLLAAAKGVTGEITVPIGIAESGRPFFVQIGVTNRSLIPLTKVRAVIRFGERGDRWTKKKKIILHQGKEPFMGKERGVRQQGRKAGRKKRRDASEMLQMDCQVTIGAPGNYTFSLRRIRIYDLTGWFWLTRKCDAQSQALVLPEPEAVPVVLGERVHNFFGDADTFDDLKPGYDPSETFDVREFRAGDRLQNVHWKLSAKNDALIVKENSLPKACPVVCFFTPGRENREKYLAMTAGISYSLMDAGCPHFAVWYSAGQKDILRTRVDDEESYYLFLTTFMQDAVFDAPQKLAEEYRRKYRGESCLHEISVGKDGIPVVDGRPVVGQMGDNLELILR
jgi:uncharacterized protein (DUF58 family)